MTATYLQIEPFLRLTITEFQKEGGFSGFVLYTIAYETNIAQYTAHQGTVKRRYSEFEWLHQRLAATYRDVPLPALPPKRTFGRFRDDFIDERKQGLQTFLQFLGNHPQIKFDRVLQLFCERGGVELTDENVEAELHELERQAKEAQARRAQQQAPTVELGPPMDNGAFQRVLRGIRENPFSSGRLELLHAVAGHSFTLEQICDAMDALPFSDERIRAARLLAPRLSPVRNPRRIAAHLRFEHERAAVRELLESLEAQQVLVRQSSAPAAVATASAPTAAAASGVPAGHSAAAALAPTSASPQALGLLHSAPSAPPRLAAPGFMLASPPAASAAPGGPYSGAAAVFAPAHALPPALPAQRRMPH